MIDTHTHLDGEEFNDDLPEVMERARQAGVTRVLVPGINWDSVDSVMSLCRRYEGYAYPMIGLQPEEVTADFRDVLSRMKERLYANLQSDYPVKYIAVGEVGLDFYWSREFESEQLEAFEEAVSWSEETRLPLEIHCRKAQNEMMRILRSHHNLPGGVFHCFTGNAHEAEELLSLDGFMLGIGGVLTFKSSHLREDLPAAVPLERIVLETDSPYMAPVPHRGKRNESAYVADVMRTLADSYAVDIAEVERQTDANVHEVFGI